MANDAAPTCDYGSCPQCDGSGGGPCTFYFEDDTTCVFNQPMTPEQIAWVRAQRRKGVRG